MLTDYIAVDDATGEVVGKYRVIETPSVPDGFSIEKVDDVSNQSIDKQADWFPN